VIWVHGTAGMGKSALLRQFATFVRDLAFREKKPFRPGRDRSAKLLRPSAQESWPSSVPWP
jgi:hypothetical protein